MSVTGDTVRCAAGDWVEIERVLLQPAERAEGLPAETAEQPLVMWTRGFAQSDVAIGDELQIETMAGRMVEGRLTAVAPGYSHSFGPPVPGLVGVGRDLRARVAAYRAGGAER